ncbi:MAG: DUF4395 domain-containing protein [Thermaceae bacterium]|nr:DUF4395 domain-containing protein [Thermaceae bacterium]
MQTKTDGNQLRFNQVLLVALIPLALLSAQPWIVGGLFVLMLSQHLGFDGLVWLKQRFRVPKQVLDEDPRPHRFARTVGAIFLGLASLSFLLGAVPLGWALGFIVVLLALLNLTTRICVGCFMYFQFRMLQHRFSRQETENV